MKAITTKYHVPGSGRAARLSASDMDGNRVFVTIPNDQTLADKDAHHLAARTLCDKMSWTGKLVGGGVKGGMVWVFVE